MSRLDAFHRKQLRSVVQVRYPQVITNADLYARCKAEKISTTIMRARWRLFGHILRSPENIPACAAMESYFAVLHDNTGYRGRRRTVLPSVLNADLKAIGRKLTSAQDLCTLRKEAQDRHKWSSLIDSILNS